jgi:hypothetical protein
MIRRERSASETPVRLALAGLAAAVKYEKRTLHVWRRRLRSFLCALAACVAATLTAQSPAAGQDSANLVEQDIKAGLLYNFLRYTQWPQSQSAMVVCVYGRDPFNGRLAQMSGRTVNQRNIEVRSVRDERETDGCSLLFLPAVEHAYWPRLHAHLERHNVLTVSDFDGFARSGGMIEFTRANNHIGIRVNVDAAEAADLVMQDRLLRLASLVRTTP